MLIPKKVKHRKWWKGRHRTQKESRGTELSFGEYGIQVVEGEAYITSRQIEAARRAMTRTMKRGGKVWIRIFPDRPITPQRYRSTYGRRKRGCRPFCFSCKGRTDIV